jgi:hypothetical protein
MMAAEAHFTLNKKQQTAVTLREVRTLATVVLRFLF